MNCAVSTIKYTVHIFNVLCALLGLVIIGISSYALGTFNNQQSTFNIIGIILGSVIFMISFFGCWGAVRESTGLMWAYAVVMGILVVVQLAVAITFHQHTFIELVSNSTKALWDMEIKANGTQPAPMATLEIDLHCCGLHSATDYENANMTIPAACYKNESKKKEDLYAPGCWIKLYDIATVVAKNLKITNWILAAVEGIAILFAVILALNFQRRRGRHELY